LPVAVSTAALQAAASDSDPVVREYVDAFNRYDVEKLRSLFTHDAIVYGVLGFGGMDKVIPLWKGLHDNLAMELHIESICAEGGTVAIRIREKGKSVGPFLGTPPTGKTSRTSGGSRA
jgi:limonene-1,2-epoxide hydrolase